MLRSWKALEDRVQTNKEKNMGKTEVGYPEGGKKYEGAEKSFGNDPRS